MVMPEEKKRKKRQELPAFSGWRFTDDIYDDEGNLLNYLAISPSGRAYFKIQFEELQSAGGLETGEAPLLKGEAARIREAENFRAVSARLFPELFEPTGAPTFQPPRPELALTEMFERDTEGFLRSLPGRGNAEDVQAFLRAIGAEGAIPEVTPPRVGFGRFIEESPFPDMDMDDLAKLAEQDFGGFLHKFREGGWTRDKESLLRDVGFSPEDVEKIIGPALPSGFAAPKETPITRIQQDKVQKMKAVLKSPDWRERFQTTPEFWDKAAWWQLAGGSMTAAIGGMASGLSGAAGRVKLKGFQKELSQLAEVAMMQRPQLEPFKPGAATLIDPKFWLTQGVELGTYMVAMVPMYMLGLAVGGPPGAAIAGASVLGRLGPLLGTIFTALVGQVGATMAESTIEAGETYNEAKRRGFSEDEANRAFDSVFGKNVTLLSGSNAGELFLAVLPGPQGAFARLMERGWVRAITKGGRVIGGTLTESGQEALQTAFTRQALGEKVAWDDEMKMVAMLGAIGGATFVGGGQIYTTITNRIQSKMTPEQKAEFDRNLAEARDAGFENEQAVRQALDKFASDKEGQAKIQESVSEALKEQQLNAIKPKDRVDALAIEKLKEKIAPEAKPKVPQAEPRAAVPEWEVTFTRSGEPSQSFRMQAKTGEEARALVKKQHPEFGDLVGDVRFIEQPAVTPKVVPEAVAPTPVTPEIRIPKELSPLVDEAKKYKTFEEFELAIFSEEWRREWRFKKGLLGDVAVMGFPKATEQVTGGKYIVSGRKGLREFWESANAIPKAEPVPEVTPASGVTTIIPKLSKRASFVVMSPDMSQERIDFANNLFIERATKANEGAPLAAQKKTIDLYPAQSMARMAFAEGSREIPKGGARGWKLDEQAQSQLDELWAKYEAKAIPKAEAAPRETAPAQAEIPPTPPSNDIPLNTNPEPTQPTPEQRNIIGLRRIEPGLTKTEIAGNFLRRGVNAIGRTTGLGQLVEAEPTANAAMRERARVLVTVESQANLLGTKWATDLQRVFTFDKKGQISSLTGVDPALPGAPTIQDVAARLPNYRDSLSGEQLEVLEGLREAIAPYRQLLEEQGIEVPLRPDVMEGGFYLPRGRAALEGAEEPFKVSGRGRGVKKGFERPAFFDSMAQGIEAGYEYSDIRQTLTSYGYDAGVRSTNTYIANYFKTLNDETGRLVGETVKMRMLRQNPEIAAKVEEIKNNLNKLKRNIGALTQRQMDVIELWQNDHEFGDIDVLLDGLETMRGGTPAQLLPELKALHQQNMDDLKELRPRYKEAMRRAQATPREQGVIILPELAGRTYPNEIANAVNVVLKTEGETIGRLSPVLNVINAYNNLYRGVRATLDDSIVGIQGLLGMYGDPKAYGVAFKLHLGAWVNDRVLGVWVKDFDASRKAAGRLTTAEMARHGLHFAGAEGTEFSLGVGTKIGELPGVKQANRAFSNFGDVIRATWADHSLETELAKGRSLEQLRVSGDLDRIMNISNSMTGWSTKKTFGSLGELVLFAPRFLQARLETATKAAMGLRPGATLDQRIARNSILKMIAIGTLLTVMANAVQGEDTDFALLRKDKEGRWRRNSKFMRIKFGGQYYSLFGTWDSLLGIFINIATGRPLQVVRSMASGIVSNAFDIITGRDYNYKATTDSPAHFAQWALSNVVPFAVSQAGRGAKQIWGGIVDGETSDIVEGAIVIGTEIFGYKSFPQEDWDAIKRRWGLFLYDEDTLLSTENVRYTWNLDISEKLRFVPLESVVDSSDYPVWVQAGAKALLLRDEYSAIPDWKLISINADPDKGATFIDFYDQWGDREVLVAAGDKASYTVKGELQPDGKRKDVTYKGEEAVKAYDQKFPDAKFGQMDQTEFVLLKEYWSLNSEELRVALVENHPDLVLNKRNERLKENPVENAYLALAGYQHIFGKAANKKAWALVKELDIPESAIPPGVLVSQEIEDDYFDYEDTVEKWGANSPEARLMRAKNKKLFDFLNEGREDKLKEITEPIPSLEIKAMPRFREINDKLDALKDEESPDFKDDTIKDENGLTARDRKIAELKETKIGDMTWIDLDRKIEAIEKGTDEAPTPDSLVNLYIERGKSIDKAGVGSASAEVMLQRVDNPDFDAWLTDEKIWGDRALKPVDRSKIPIWRIDVKMAALDKDSPQYARLNRQRDAHINGFSDIVDVYVDWYETPKAGYHDDWFLMENKDFYDRMVGKGLLSKRDFSKVPDIKWRDEWDTMPPRKQEAIIKGIPELLLDDYVAYFEIPPKPTDYPTGFPNWEDDWWMMEHPDFYKEVYLKILGKPRKDYRKVPTREVWAKYLHYDSLDFRAEQDKYRLDNPDLDEWGVLYGIWKETMTEKRRRMSISQAERMSADIEKRLKELEEAVRSKR